eukprot:41878-Pyramimonas_sp.AAC.1
MFHEELRQEAISTGFPLALLKGLCAAHRLPQRAVWQGAVSSAVSANGTLVALRQLAAAVLWDWPIF